MSIPMLSHSLSCHKCLSYFVERMPFWRRASLNGRMCVWLCMMQVSNWKVKWRINVGNGIWEMFTFVFDLNFFRFHSICEGSNGGCQFNAAIYRKHSSHTLKMEMKYATEHLFCLFFFAVCSVLSVHVYHDVFWPFNWRLRTSNLFCHVLPGHL